MPTSGPKSLSGSSAMDDYLEQILHLIEDKGYARVIDISKKLGIAQASVTNMVQKLDAQGLVHYEKYRGLVLTSAGEKIARAITRRHQSLADFLRLFALDPQTIEQDVEGMEHHISTPTLDVIVALIQELKKNPQMVERIKKKIRPG